MLSGITPLTGLSLRVSLGQSVLEKRYLLHFTVVALGLVAEAMQEVYSNYYPVFAKSSILSSVYVLMSIGKAVTASTHCYTISPSIFIW
jgi:hypothetical protein